MKIKARKKTQRVNSSGAQGNRESNPNANCDAPPDTRSLKEVFARIDKIRKHAKPLKGVTIKQLIEEGRI